MGLANIRIDTSVAYNGQEFGVGVATASTAKAAIYDSFLTEQMLTNPSIRDQIHKVQSVAPEIFETPDALERIAGREPHEGGYKIMGEILDENFDHLKESYPDLQLKSRDDIYLDAGKVIKAQREQADADQKNAGDWGGRAAWLMGSAAGYGTDPISVMSMAFPLLRVGKGIGFVSRVSSVGATEVAVEGVIQASTWQMKQDMGLEPTFGDALTAMRDAGLGAMLLYGTGSGLLAGGKKAGEVIGEAYRKGVKDGEITPTKELDAIVDDIEVLGDLVADSGAKSLDDVNNVIDEYRKHQEAAYNGDAVDGMRVAKESQARQVDAINSNITEVEASVEKLTLQRNKAQSVIDARASDVEQLPVLEELATRKLSRSEKKALDKEIAAAVKESGELQARLQSRMDANYDLMADVGVQQYKKSVEAMRAENNRLIYRLEQKMDELEARKDESIAAERAASEIRKLRKRLSEDVDLEGAALRIQEIDAQLADQDQMLYALQEERGAASKPLPEPEEVVALEQALEADMKVAEEAIAVQEAAQVEAARPAKRIADAEKVEVTVPTADKFGVKPITEKDNPYRDVMPTFQGGKQKVSDATYNLIRKYWPESDRAKITEIDDYFGGGGAWGMYNALSHFTNVNKVRVYEFDPRRMKKIQFFHKYGDQIPQIIQESENLKKVFDLATQYAESKRGIDIDKQGKKAVTGQSASVLASQIRKNLDSFELTDAEIGLAYAINDLGALSRGTAYRHDIGKTAADRLEHLLAKIVKQGTEARRAGLEAEKRGIEIEYHQGDSYTKPNPKGDHVLAVVDPPYYFTTGYSPSGKKETVKLDLYAKTNDLLSRLDAADNHILYTDEAWWGKKSKNKKTGEVTETWPDDMHEQIGGKNAFDMVNEISSNMTDFVTLPVAGRTETLGLRNAFRHERNGASKPAIGTQDRGAIEQPVRRGAGVDTARASRQLDSQLENNGWASRATAGDVKLEAKPTKEATIDEMADAEITRVQEAVEVEDMQIGGVNEFGESITVSAKQAMRDSDDSIAAIKNVMECGN